MGEATEIGWTDHTFNPWWGCVEVSPACDNCYAKRDSVRYGHHVWGKDLDRRMLSEANWAKPVAWNRKASEGQAFKLVFSGSMCDVMEDRRDLDPLRLRLYRLIKSTPFLIWLLLTKRPQNFKRFLPPEWLSCPLANVCLMTTVESNDYSWRLETLLNTPARTRAISYEPAVGPLDLTGLMPDWVIAGGESGPGARPAHPDWFRSVRDQCVSANVPFFFKQWGEWLGAEQDGQNAADGQLLNSSLVSVRVGKKAAGALLDGIEWKQFPRFNS